MAAELQCWEDLAGIAIKVDADGYANFNGIRVLAQELANSGIIRRRTPTALEVERMATLSDAISFIQQRGLLSTFVEWTRARSQS